MTGELTLAVAQPVSLLGNLSANVREHSRMVRDLASRVVVFPELSLTGYGMHHQPVDPGDSLLEPLVEACAECSTVALAGAPTQPIGEANPRISTLRIDREGVTVAYSKMYLGGDESNHYSPGDAPAVVQVDGWRLGLAICKDTGQIDHAVATARLGIDAYVAGVCETEEDRHVQPRRAALIAHDHSVWVAYSSFAGATGGGFTDTAGRSAVRDPNGTVPLQLGKPAGQGGIATLTR